MFTATRSRRRYLRTTILGILAMAALLWAAVDQFGMSRERVLELLMTTLLVVAVIIVIAALGAGLWILLRRLFGRR
jgi:hypothetical protein